MMQNKWLTAISRAVTLSGRSDIFVATSDIAHASDCDQFIAWSEPRFSQETLTCRCGALIATYSGLPANVE